MGEMGQGRLRRWEVTSGRQVNGGTGWHTGNGP